MIPKGLTERENKSETFILLQVFNFSHKLIVEQDK